MEANQWPSEPLDAVSCRAKCRHNTKRRLDLTVQAATTIHAFLETAILARIQRIVDDTKLNQKSFTELASPGPSFYSSATDMQPVEQQVLFGDPSWANGKFRVAAARYTRSKSCNRKFFALKWISSCPVGCCRV
eukprot:s1355_g23.t1